MQIIRRALVFGGSIFCLLVLSLGTARAQEIPPSTYLFVEVRNTEGKAVSDATVTVSALFRNRISSENTDKDGAAKLRFYHTPEHHYDLQISKPGYLPYEQVFFTYPSDNSRDFFGRVDVLSNSEEELKKSQSLPVKIVLLRTPVTLAERQAAEVEEWKRQLLLAAKRGDAASLDKLLQAGVKADTADAGGVPAINWAAFAGGAETIKLLLAAGADVRNKDKPGHQALLIYLSDGILRGSTTRKQGNESNTGPEKTPLERNEEVVRRLIEAGAGVDVQNPYRGTVLNRAIALISDAAQISYALSIETIKALMAAGAKVNAVDESGQTPLMTATRARSLEAIKLLLASGAGPSINVRDKTGQTALMYAVPRYYKDSPMEIVKLLIAAGADVNAVNEDGQTALMLAAQTGSIETIKMLLEAGAAASINAKDKKGQTVLMYVKSRYSGSVDEIIQALKAAGANADGAAAAGRPH